MLAGWTVAWSSFAVLANLQLGEVAQILLMRLRSKLRCRLLHNAEVPRCPLSRRYQGNSGRGDYALVFGVALLGHSEWQPGGIVLPR